MAGSTIRTGVAVAGSCNDGEISCCLLQLATTNTLHKKRSSIMGFPLCIVLIASRRQPAQREHHPPAVPGNPRNCNQNHSGRFSRRLPTAEGGSGECRVVWRLVIAHQFTQPNNRCTTRRNILGCSSRFNRFAIGKSAAVSCSISLYLSANSRCPVLAKYNPIIPIKFANSAI